MEVTAARGSGWNLVENNYTCGRWQTGTGLAGRMHLAFRNMLVDSRDASIMKLKSPRSAAGAYRSSLSVSQPAMDQNKDRI